MSDLSNFIIANVTYMEVSSEKFFPFLWSGVKILNLTSTSHCETKD